MHLGAQAFGEGLGLSRDRLGAAIHRALLLGRPAGADDLRQAMQHVLAGVELAIELIGHGLGAVEALAEPDVTRMGHSVDKPVILTKPTEAQIQAAYPERALADQVEGKAAMDCMVMADGKLARCQIAGELPAGYGFGQATLDLAGDFVMKPRTVDGDPVCDGGGQSRGLSGPCPGQDEDRSGVGSRLDLGLGEA